MNRLWLAAALAAIAISPATGQYRAPDGHGAPDAQRFQCLTPEARQRIHTEIEERVAELRAVGLLETTATAKPKLAWPLRGTEGDPGYHATFNFVDHDPSYTNQLLDYNCGGRTYDIAGYNHQGTDYVSWPFWWYKMDHEEVEVVAAAPGTIVAKYDGNPDRSCSFGGSWNAVYVMHDDGSIAWYGHLKKGTPTAKPEGASVSAGEYLGVVGSSGSSTLPHLHFELYDAARNLNDPYEGPCNRLNNNGWWKSQEPYYDSAVNLAATHSAPPVFPPCPQTETPNLRDHFDPGDTVIFAAYYRDQRANQESVYRVYAADGSLWDSWSHSFSSPNFYAASYWYWSVGLPGSAPQGEWRFEVTYRGKTTVHRFTVGEVGDDDDDDDVDPEGWMSTDAVPGFRFKAVITNQAGDDSETRKDAACIEETLCISGAIPGRSEVFARVVGPKPNGYLWPTLVKFTTSEVEITIEQLATGETRTYVLEGASPGDDVLRGEFDREGFLPEGESTSLTAAAAGSRVVELVEAVAADPRDAPPPPAGDWMTSGSFPDFRAKAQITSPTGEVIDTRQEAACIDETICVSGALPGRSELYVRVVGPKPNGFMWPTLVKFTTSQVEVWIEQLSTGQVNYYLLEGASPGSDDLSGLFDRRGFSP